MQTAQQLPVIELSVAACLKPKAQAPAPKARPLKRGLVLDALRARGRPAGTRPEATAQLKLGPEADLKEWHSPAIVKVEVQDEQHLIWYQDGTVERCSTLPSGHKDGTFMVECTQHLNAAALHQGQALVIPDYYPQQVGSYFHGLPCGKFTCRDECHNLLCSGHYELILGGSLVINLTELTTRLNKGGKLRGMFSSEVEQWAQARPGAEPSVNVQSHVIVARYHKLSYTLENSAQFFFNLGADTTPIIIERQDDETWVQACYRTHLKVLSLVRVQIHELQAAQCAAYAEPEAPAQMAQEASPQDQAQIQAKAQARILLRRAQRAELMAGAQRGGYAHMFLKCLAQADDGTYLNAIWVSSPEYLERLCAGAPSPQTRRYKTKQGKLSPRQNKGAIALPLMHESAPPPIKLKGDLAQFISAFNWHACANGGISDLTGTESLLFNFGPLGLLQGNWHQYHRDSCEHGTMEHGRLGPTIKFELYQERRARFPTASFTVNISTGQFEGPYQLFYDISELFDQGYHAVLLEPYEVATEAGTQILKRLRPYERNTYVRERGKYINGKPKATKRYQLERYRPQYFDDEDEDYFALDFL